MLGFVRDKLVKLVKTDKRVKKYLRRLDELHKTYILFSLVNLKKSGLNNYEIRKEINVI